ncbi:hypothetical protein J437_LFUL004973 [Ladona fulva]|uniref:Protein fuzzy homolog n=1 Tax=Ladona fulva TaxID=123851 RepID=A0A8K0NSY2_LADFU|nr:hypothetical protein J437_LFUL004973 [Ladona fulva]
MKLGITKEAAANRSCQKKVGCAKKSLKRVNRLMPKIGRYLEKNGNWIFAFYTPNIRVPQTTLSFAVVASLNGVHMFTKSQSAVLHSTTTKESTVVWRDFESSLTLIGAVTGVPEIAIYNLLGVVFDAMVLMVGIEELKEIRNVDRLKRNIRFCSPPKVCFPLIDRLLESIKPEGKMGASNDLVGLTEVILCHENHLLQGILDTYAEAIDSMYGCLLIHGKIAVATSGWWSLTPVERSLLSLLASVENLATLQDIPIFLPHKSPNVPFRLVTCRLLPWAEVLVLCGPKPSLQDVERIAIQSWRLGNETLRAANVHCPTPRNIPSSLMIDGGILGFLLVDENLGKFMLSTNVLGDGAAHGDVVSHPVSEAHRKMVLRTFYWQISSTFMPSSVKSPDEETQNVSSIRECPPRALESYWCSEYHKCHAMQLGSNQIFVLYSAAVPTPTMRVLSRNTLKMIVNDKQLCW